MWSRTGAKLEALLDAKIQWKAHNYNHLHEAPTVFYAVALLLAMIGRGDGMNATIAWVYVGLRIAHSLWQSLVNNSHGTLCVVRAFHPRADRIGAPRRHGVFHG